MLDKDLTIFWYTVLHVFASLIGVKNKWLRHSINALQIYLLVWLLLVLKTKCYVTLYMDLICSFLLLPCYCSGESDGLEFVAFDVESFEQCSILWGCSSFWNSQGAPVVVWQASQKPCRLLSLLVLYLVVVVGVQELHLGATVVQANFGCESRLKTKVDWQISY